MRKLTRPFGKGEVVSSILTGSTIKSPTDKGLSNVRKNSRCEFVQNETRSDARKRTKPAPKVRQMFARRTCSFAWRNER